MAIVLSRRTLRRDIQIMIIQLGKIDIIEYHAHLQDKSWMSNYFARLKGLMHIIKKWVGVIKQAVLLSQFSYFRFCYRIPPVTRPRCVQTVMHCASVGLVYSAAAYAAIRDTKNWGGRLEVYTPLAHSCRRSPRPPNQPPLMFSRESGRTTTRQYSADGFVRASPQDMHRYCLSLPLHPSDVAADVSVRTLQRKAVRARCGARADAPERNRGVEVRILTLRTGRSAGTSSLQRIIWHKVATKLLRRIGGLAARQDANHGTSLVQHFLQTEIFTFDKAVKIINYIGCLPMV